MKTHCWFKNCFEKWTILLFQVLFLIGFAHSSFGQGQANRPSSDPSVIPSVFEADLNFDPASKVNEIQEQILTVEKSASLRKNEIQELENYIGDLNSIKLIGQYPKNYFDDRWKNLELKKVPYDVEQYFNGMLYDYYIEDYLRNNFQNIYNNSGKGVYKLLQKLSSDLNTLRSKFGIPEKVYLDDEVQLNSFKNDILPVAKIKMDIDSLNKFRKEANGYVDISIQEAEALKIKAEEYVKNANKKIRELNKKIEEVDITINHRAINIGLPWFCVTVILLFVIAFIYQKMQIAKNAAGGTADNFITSILLEVITVLLITLTILILGLARILTENVLGTLLGGIAGYVLNRTKTGAASGTRTP